MEPERPIEKLLRAYAKKRLEGGGAPETIHPATRRLLQTEVERKFAKDRGPAGSWIDRLSLLWPRFAWGIAILAVLGVIAVMVLPPAKRTANRSLLVKNE